MEKVLFGAGCFWGVEETFRKVTGVVSTEVGYSGGNTENPTYKTVCQGNTNHAEVVNIFFDNTKKPPLIYSNGFSLIFLILI